MFIVKILLANVLVPTLVSTSAALVSKIGWGKASGQPSEEGNEGQPKTTYWLMEVPSGALAAAVAMWLAFALRNGFSIYPEDAWLRIPIATAMVGVCGMLSCLVQGLLRWAIRLGFLVFAAWVVFPVGESWGFLASSQYYWIAALALSSLVGWLGVETRSPRDSGVLALSWIACFAASAFLTAQSFLRVTEPLLAVSSIVGCFGIATIVFRRSYFLQGATGPCLFAFAAAIANAQFNSFLEISDVLSWLAMFSPALVALVSAPFVSTPSNSKVEATRVIIRGLAVTLISSLLFAAAIVIWTQVASGGGDEEW